MRKSFQESMRYRRKMKIIYGKNQDMIITLIFICFPLRIGVTKVINVQSTVLTFGLTSEPSIKSLNSLNVHRGPTKTAL